MSKEHEIKEMSKGRKAEQLKEDKEGDKDKKAKGEIIRERKKEVRRK